MLVAPTGGPIVVTAQPNPTESSDAIKEFETTLEPGDRVERWNAGAWQQAATFDTLAAVPDELGMSFALPPLPEGMYRVVRRSPAGDVFREFWVVSNGHASENDRSGPGRTGPLLNRETGSA
jgi:hypothetical protein